MAHASSLQNTPSTQRPHRVCSNEELLRRACLSIAGGDSSTMRVLPYHLPLVADRGKGSRLWDADNNEYIDLNMAYGPLIFGHCPAKIVERVYDQISQRGSQLGFPSEINIRVAEKIKHLFPSIQLMRFANSGTEAVASSIRLARAYTGRRKIIVFEGHYHGWSDATFHRYHAPLDELPSADFGPALPGTLGMNDAPQDLVAVRWNNLDALARCLESDPHAFAGCIMEPVMGNAGVIAPQPGFLQHVRELLHHHGSLLIFDEVITGMRIAPGGAQELFQVQPDITVVSKALAGGYPVAGFGASREIMDLVVQGTLFHGGVYSSNAVVMSAAEAVLDEVLTDSKQIYDHLYAIANQLAGGLRDILSRSGISHVVQNVGPMVSVFLTRGNVEALCEYRDVRQHCDFDRYIELQHRLQQSGVYFHPNQFEPMFPSTAHTTHEIDLVLDRFEEAVRCRLVA